MYLHVTEISDKWKKSNSSVKTWNTEHESVITTVQDRYHVLPNVRLFEKNIINRT